MATTKVRFARDEILRWATREVDPYRYRQFYRLQALGVPSRARPAGQIAAHFPRGAPTDIANTWQFLLAIAIEGVKARNEQLGLGISNHAPTREAAGRPGNNYPPGHIALCFHTNKNSGALPAIFDS